MLALFAQARFHTFALLAQTLLQSFCSVQARERAEVNPDRGDPFPSVLDHGVILRATVYRLFSHLSISTESRIVVGI